jgi:WD40-like Beta Propeller Repeat
MRDRLTPILQLALLMVSADLLYGQNERPITAPDSVVLSGWQYGDLFVTTSDGSFRVTGPPGSSDQGYFVLPALSPNGDLIAWGLTLPDVSGNAKCDPRILGFAVPGLVHHRSTMGVYSLLDKTWNTYGDFCELGAGSAAFSPDGMKVAFEAKIDTGDRGCFSDYATEALLILDLASGMFTQIPDTVGVMANARISWSPDGKYIAAQFGSWAPSSRIVLIAVGSWVQKQIAEGWDPSWSPKGDLISYETGEGTKCMIARPDGTQARLVLHAAGGSQIPMGAVWSPDEKTLWLSEEEFSGKTKVASVDLATGKVKKMPKYTPSVFGWVQNH